MKNAPALNGVRPGDPLPSAAKTAPTLRERYGVSQRPTRLGESTIVGGTASESAGVKSVTHPSKESKY
jgi:hypothetical protein